MILDKGFVFIIGSSRSGTTWLQEMLASHPGVCAHAELELFRNYLAPWLASWKMDIRDTSPSGLPTVYSKSEFDEVLRDF